MFLKAALLFLTLASAASAASFSSPARAKDVPVKQCKYKLDENNIPATVNAETLYSGTQPINIIKHRKEGSSKWSFWLTDTTKNCSEVHFYPDDYYYEDPTTDDVPLITGSLKTDPETGEFETIGDGGDFYKTCCMPNSDKPNQSTITNGADVAHAININYRFYQKFFNIPGIDQWGAPIEAFVLHKSDGSTFSRYEPPHRDGPLYHQLQFYKTFKPFNDNIASINEVSHVISNAHWFSQVYDANEETWDDNHPYGPDAHEGYFDKPQEGGMLDESYAALFANVVENWALNQQGDTLCGTKESCKWIVGNELFEEVITVLTDPPVGSLYDYTWPERYPTYFSFYPEALAAYKQYKWHAGRYIIGTAYHNLYHGLVKCTYKLRNPHECPRGTNAFISKTFEGVSLDNAFKIMAYPPEQYDSGTDFREARGRTLFHADKEFKAEDPALTSTEYKATQEAFNSVQVYGDSIKPYFKYDSGKTSEQVEPSNPVIDVALNVKDSKRKAGDQYQVDLYADGKQLTDSEGGPVYQRFMFSSNDPEEVKQVNFEGLKVPLSEGQSEVELVAVLSDIYGGERIATSKTLPVGNKPTLHSPDISYVGYNSETGDSSGIPEYKATVEVDAPEGGTLNLEGSYLELDTGAQGAEDLRIDVNKENCSIYSEEEFVCSGKFNVDPQIYNDGLGYVQDPDDGGSSDDYWEHKTYQASYKYVEFGGSGEGE